MSDTSSRRGVITRKTGETDIQLDLLLDGQGDCSIDSGVPFLNHMLIAFTVHGFFDLLLKAEGDIEVDDHHTVEDIGICLGQAFAKALGEKRGIRRYGSSYLPMDEALVRVVVDFSNRPYLYYGVDVTAEKIGRFETCLVKEFLRALVLHGGMTMHVDMLRGENAHHVIEAVFKGLARALHEATRPLSIDEVLSSKGCL